MIWLYTFLLKLIRLSLPVLKRIPHKKISYYFSEQGKIHVFRDCKNPIWIHASSGEIEYARSLIRELQASFPQIPILVTHTSMSSLKTLQNLGVEAIGVSPLDEENEVRKFLERAKPRVCLIARTDLWPHMLKELNRLKIPAYLFSATFSKGTKKASFMSQQLLKASLPLLTKIYFVSLEDQALCLKLYPNVTGEVLGDTRYDQVLFRLGQKAVVHLPAFDKILIAGSTWEQDEAVLAEAAVLLKTQNWKWLWVPHEVHDAHLGNLEAQLKQARLSVIRLSQISNSFQWKDIDVLIVDRVGLLASLYPLAKIAFIGGSFRKQVHSVMEALGAGLPVIVGPYHHNNREALEFKHLGFVQEVHNSNQFYDSVLAFEKNLSTLEPKLIEKIQMKKGATNRLMASLESEGLFLKN